jgi:formate/nitrite transporter FocA (FNT family)
MRLAARALGFAIPTIALVTALHIDRAAREHMAAEVLDGIVSGIAFTLPFVLVAWVRSHLEGDRASARTRSLRIEFAFGFLAAVVAWAALWVGWTLPAVQAQRPNAFWWNCVVMALAGVMLPAAGRGAREPEPLEEPATTH